MKLLLSYLKRYRAVLALALFLAAINQIFSLLDPWIFQHILDNYLVKVSQFTAHQFFTGVGVLLLLAVGAALVSRIAKNFQDYYTNVVIQRLGAKVYADGLEHSLQLPYATFEDQSSGETLGRLQQVRLDIQNLILTFVGTIFTSSIGFVFVSVYAAFINLWIAAAFLVTMPIIAGVSLLLSTRIKRVQKDIFAKTTALAGSTTESLRNIELVKSLGLADQEIARLNEPPGKFLSLSCRRCATCAA